VTDIDPAARAWVRCPRCNGQRDPDEFIASTGRLYRTCRKCRDGTRQRNRERRERIGADGVRADNLRTKYGISVEEYDALRARQDYRCAICGTHEDALPPAGVGRPRLDGRPTAVPVKLVVDHCHHSRRVRGLLCVGCNAAIGQFRDNETALWGAVRYLRSCVTDASR
jgi:recombination endonuclease VII